MSETERALANTNLRTTPVTFRMCLTLAVMRRTGCTWGEAYEAVALAAAGHPEWPDEETLRTVRQWQGKATTEYTTENGEQQ